MKARLSFPQNPVGRAFYVTGRQVEVAFRGERVSLRFSHVCIDEESSVASVRSLEPPVYRMCFATPSGAPLGAKRGVMDRPRIQASASPDQEPFDATFVAEMVRSDFKGLISILERLSSRSRADSETQSTLGQARTAAERGLGLSHQLVEALRSAKRK